MASSVARMPSDDWRHRPPSRLAAAGVLGAHVHQPKPLPKVLTHISTSIDTGAAAAAAREPCSPATAAKRRQSQILDRWAARQARGMITTIERQAHEAELSALSTTTQPVSARAASFLRETSPGSSESSTASSAVSGVGAPSAADIPPNVRASSLIQMWRELEAEAGVSPTRGAGTASAGSGGGGVPSSAAVDSHSTVCSPEATSGGSDACDEADAEGESAGDWDSTEHAPSSSASSTVAESDLVERRRVDDIKRMLSLKISSSVAFSGDEAESLGSAPVEKEIPSNGLSPNAKGRREIEGLIVKLEQERRREVAALAERHPVSRFPFRGRIQSLIRLKSLRREVATIRHQQRSRKLEAERCQSRLNGQFLREISEDESQHDVNGMRREENTESDSHDSGIENSIDHSDIENNQYPELATTEILYSPQAFFTPLSRREDLQESRGLDASWDERNSWRSSLDWQTQSDSSVLQAWCGEVIAERMESSSRDQHVTSTKTCWLSESLNAWQGWGVNRRTFCRDLFASSTEKGELLELLERKIVSTSLASDFPKKMNRIIASFLRRQEQYINKNDEEDNEDQGIQRQNYESGSDHETATFFIPLPSQMLQHQESWQSTSFKQNPSVSLKEDEVICGVKNDMARIRDEITQVKKLVESCLDWQTKFEQSIKQEVSSAFNQLVGTEKLLHEAKWRQGRKDTCCICCEAQVDSLLYRCGHMCACFKCAQELQWSSGRCPICRSLIVDVVRAYPNT
ncbi:putative E3 ubiquitin-protein ligase LUL3 [Apostasia shenzhenica]|uniref:Putative E3 ubiquitin-protein ligase LUL3 n=1 Tax=Apostasia shenzhenica TaxID=1088818 RepID=A0A2H9ZTR2_9ASPA|nr:putative E3 ubiquitin-protein ligase LUL3 [Apostasia shenzhenica]